MPQARGSIPDGPSVAVVGAGIAGLTTALRLSQRGYNVTLYEEKGILGGNVASQDFGDHIYHDVYPHMFADWYDNFWEIFETDLGLDRKLYFEPRTSVKFLKADQGNSPKYQEMKNPTNLRSVLGDLLSKVLPAADMFLLGYSMLDLVTTPFDLSKLLSQISVDGFLHSRPYATERSALGHERLLTLIWSIHGSLTSASSYKGFLRHAFGFSRSTPFAWMLKGNVQGNLIGPLQKKLEAHGCTIRPNSRVDTVFLRDDGKVRVNYEKDSYDYLVLAVPAAALAKLVLDPDPGFLGFGGIIKEGSIVDQLPGLSELRRLRAERIAVVDLYFKKKLPGIPKEHVALIQSNGDLTFLDISQLWTDDSNMRDRTVLVLAASDVYALPAADIYARPSKNTRIMQKNAYVMIQTLHRYLPVFNPGDRWGDPKSDICYTKSQFLSNVSNTLFVNEVGSWAWRPTASYEALPNVFFAGDFCRTDVDMATVEAAVLSGLLAAQALWKKKPRGKPIVIAKSRVYGDSTFLALKLLLMPFAYGAKGWSTACDAAPELFQGNLSRGLISPAASMIPLPVTYTVEWWKTAYAFWKSVLGAGKGQSEPAGTVESSVLSLKVK